MIQEQLDMALAAAISSHLSIFASKPSTVLFMKWLLIILTMTVHNILQAQGAPDAYMSRFHRAFDYTAGVVQAMPEGSFDFTPVDSVFTFAEQINHAIRTVARHTEYYYLDSLGSDINERYSKENLSKTVLLERIETTRNHVAKILATIPADDWNGRTIKFFSGDFATADFFQILLDHMTHHRGMAIVYLRMQGIKPPQYVGW